MSLTLPPLLRLPPELHVEILTYLLVQGGTITIRENKCTPWRRRWSKEIERLRDPMWKPTKRVHLSILRTCKQVYGCGLKAFWGGNDFVFSTQDSLQIFLSTCHEEAKNSIRSMVFGEGLSAHPNSTAHQPSLDLTLQLSSLQHLDLIVWLHPLMNASISDHSHLAGGQRFNSETYNADCTDITALCINTAVTQAYNYYASDMLVHSIPDVVFNRLKRIRLRVCKYGYAYDADVGGYTRDMMQYATDIRSKKWSVCPFKTGSEAGQTSHMIDNVENGWKVHLWHETRAAAYWDYNASIWHGIDATSTQWATWSAMWAWEHNISGNSRGVGLAPRPWCEVFADSDGAFLEGYRPEDDIYWHGWLSERRQQRDAKP